MSGRGRGRGGHHQTPRQQTPSSSSTTTATASSSSASGGKFDTVQVSSLPNAKTLPSSKLVLASQGTSGSKVNLITNYFPLKLAEGTFYQYALKFNPEVENPRLLHFLLKNCEKLKDKIYITDGLQVLFTKDLLDKEKKNIEQVVQADGKTFKITIVFASTVGSGEISLEYIHLFNLVHRRALRHLKLTQIGRNFFNMKASTDISSYNLKVLSGLLSTIYAAEKGLLFNADMIYRTLRTDSILDFIYEKRDESQHGYEDAVNKALSGTIALCSYNNKTVYIDGVDFGKSPKSTFSKNGSKVTFAQYYKDKHKIVIKDMSQPLITSFRREVNKTTGKKERVIQYFIPELLNMTGLTDEMRRNYSLMKAVKDITGLDPTDRMRNTIRFLKESINNADYAQELETWQYHLEPRALEVSGRVLPAEQIKFGDNKTVMPNERGYSWDIRENKMFRTSEIAELLTIIPADGKHYKPFLDFLKETAGTLGCKITNFLPPITVNTKTRDVAKEYLNVLEKDVKPSTKFVLIVLPNDKKPVYDGIKKFLDAKGISSQCVLGKNAEQGSKNLQSKATKIAIAIFTKVGGAPWTVPFKFPANQPSMVIGMDVYHSGEIGQKSKNSIVGFVASQDMHFSKFFSDVIIQAPGKEIVDGLAVSFLKALKQFYNNNKIYPKHVIVYRDGVGEGQIEEVQATEVAAMTNVLKSMKELEDCNLAYLLVVKRINTRLYKPLSEAKTAVTNPAPGTIVDSDIVTKGAMEFFLVSQSVTQGTATPTKYQCIHNTKTDILTAEYLQTLAFKLCHVYYNWMGTIRVPCVCQYAHKYAYMVGQTLGKGSETQNTRLFYL